MLLWTLKIGLLVYLGFGLYLYLWQRSFMYFPTQEQHVETTRHEYLNSAGESLKIWVLGAAREKAVIYFGGNAENVYANTSDFLQMLPDYTIYLVNYRGFGGSSGSPTESALFTDALNIYDQLSARHSQISLVGRSLGSGVAVFLASNRPVRRLVLATPHDSALSVAQSMYPIYPISMLLKDKYQSTDYASRVTTPTLIMTAQHDRIIPPRHSARLAQAFKPGLVEQVVIENAGHNGLAGFKKYWEEIRRFLNQG